MPQVCKLQSRNHPPPMRKPASASINCSAPVPSACRRATWLAQSRSAAAAAHHHTNTRPGPVRIHKEGTLWTTLWTDKHTHTCCRGEKGPARGRLAPPAGTVHQGRRWRAAERAPPCLRSRALRCTRARGYNAHARACASVPSARTVTQTRMPSIEAERNGTQACIAKAVGESIMRESAQAGSSLTILVLHGVRDETRDLKHPPHHHASPLS
eukprot:3867579-Rhodomonas_salina.5